MWKEFRKFVAKGNLVDLAVAFIMGVAFGALVKSLVNDLIMPIIGKLVGNVDFANQPVHQPLRTGVRVRHRSAGGGSCCHLLRSVYKYID